MVIYIFAFIFLFYSFIIFPVARNPVVAQSTYYAMNRHHESEFGSYVEASKNSTLFNWLPIFAFSTSYISHPYAKFTFFFLRTISLVIMDMGHIIFLLLKG